MLKQGTIRHWDVERGFGFIDSRDSRDVFFHVRDLAKGLDPVQGMSVTYEEIQVGGKGPRAMAVRPISVKSHDHHSAPAPRRNGSGASGPQQRRSNAPVRTAAHASGATGSSLAMVLMVVWLGVLGWGVWMDRLPLWAPVALLVLNGATYIAYAIDKNAAQSGAWRISEKTLQTMALLGGWPAAWWAQQWLRHKSAKREFRIVYWFCMLANCAVMTALVWQPAALTGLLHRVA